jgi:hypothetical protein
MRSTLLPALLIACCGCTSTSLGQHTVNQAVSIADMRYHEVLDNLAIVAHNQGTLPSFATTNSGSANLTNTISADATTFFSNSVNGFSEELLNVFGSHNPELNWTVDPVVAEPLLEALKYASMWAVCGHPPDAPRAMDLLREPRREDIYGCHHADYPGRLNDFHLGVADQLASLPHDWLHIGCLGDVPRSACYKAHCCGTYVWVNPEGMAGLSAFTLIVLDIATIDPTRLIPPIVMAKVEIQLKAPKLAASTVASFAAPIDLSADDQPKPKPDTVQEQWFACQEPNASGQIKLIRPGYLRHLPSQVPDVGPEDSPPPPPMPPTPGIVP